MQIQTDSKSVYISFIICEGTNTDCPHGGHLDVMVRDLTGLDRSFPSMAFHNLCFKWMIYNIGGLS